MDGYVVGRWGWNVNYPGFPLITETFRSSKCFADIICLGVCGGYVGGIKIFCVLCGVECVDVL